MQKRTNRKPVGLGRNERAGRVGSRSSFSYEKAESEYADTGVFHTPRPKLVGVSDAVRISNRDLARRASREMARWRRTLPAGTKLA